MIFRKTGEFLWFLKTGKALGTQERRGKNTYVTVLDLTQHHALSDSKGPH
jgi:hypothetical protein